jgi:hypothetical protein
MASRIGSRELGRQQASRALVVATAITAALYIVPQFLPVLAWVAWPLVLLSTIAHELGHGLAAMLVGGDFERLFVYADASGAAQYRGAFGGPAHAFVAAMGPLGPPLAALALFAAARHAPSARVALAVFAAGLVIATALWARNPFGIACLLVIAGTLGLIAWRAGSATSQITAVFLAIQLSLAAFSRADYLFSATASTGAGPMLSDTAQIAAVIGLTYWFWGGLLAAASVAILGVGAWWFLRAAR